MYVFISYGVFKDDVSRSDYFTSNGKVSEWIMNWKGCVLLAYVTSGLFDPSETGKTLWQCIVFRVLSVKLIGGGGGGGENIAQIILNLGTCLRCVVSFRPRPLYLPPLPGKSCRYPLDKRLDGNQSFYVVMEYRKISCPCRESNYNSSVISPGPTTMPTTLSWFIIRGNYLKCC
jgi:hypothetical protein